VELVFISLLTLICFPVVTLGEGIVRIILGVIFLLIFPGYTVMAALFPGKNSVKNIERAVFTVILSLVLISLAGLVLNFTPWGIKLTSVFTALSCIIVIASGIALLRRYALPEAERFTLKFKIKISKWGKIGKFDIGLSVLLAVLLVGAIFSLTYVLSQPKPKDAFSNFYVLGASGMMTDYPVELTLGGQTGVTLGIENHESQDTSYEIKVSYDGVETQSIGPILLSDEGKWSDEVTLAPTKTGNNQKVEFLLYKEGEPAPYLSLHLWLNVKE
jgi:uncharacterized membrane protein